MFTVAPSGATVLSLSSSSSTLPLRVVVERLDVSPAMKPELLREERGVEVSASRHVYPGAVEGQRSHLARCSRRSKVTFGITVVYME